MQALMHRALRSAPQVQAGRCQVETTERQFDSFIILPLDSFVRLTVWIHPSDELLSWVSSEHFVTTLSHRFTPQQSDTAQPWDVVF